MQKLTHKTKEWLRRYVPAELLGTLCAVATAWLVYHHTGSFLAATAAGLIGEGIGFYGYFVTAELRHNAQKYRDKPVLKRLSLAVSVASSNLLVEFAPAELLDTFLIRPFAMFIIPQHIHPYPLGFLAGKFSADVFFYAFAILGYELRKRLQH